MKKWQFIILILGIIFLVSFLVSKTIEGTESLKPNRIAIIPIYGSITVDSSSDIFFDQAASPSTVVIEALARAEKDPSVKGIILEINSPGGTVVASREISNKIKKIDKPVVSWIREVGASGAYWIATSTDYIVADPMSITGSIGVIGSYLEFSELFEKYGIKYERLVGGQYKDTGTPFRDLSNQEKQLLQSKINMIHEAFINEVATNRKIDRDTVRELSTGMFYLGQEALDLGLIDELGSQDEALNKIKGLAKIKDAEVVSFQRKVSLVDIITRLTAYNSFYIGKGIGTSIFADINSNSIFSA
ncbi:signal peptide peptidase SppA [Candidatus Woesearchaeota archaeon]|nr:signal peptide peptidase SppA [Candidatus Woesearchaeota archaeon]